MDILKELKNLKNIEPDKGFLVRSKADIMAPKVLAGQFFGARFINPRMAFASFSMVAALLLAFIKFVSPLEVAQVDHSALKAEAQAIDIQIELTNLNYPEAEEEVVTKETTPSKSAEIKSVKKVIEPDLDESIEKALQELSE